MYVLGMTSTIGTPVDSRDEELTRRALAHAQNKTTDLADTVLRVPLHYYRDPKITELEESQILRRVPLAIVPSAQVAGVNDYVVRSVLGDSLLVTRDRTGAGHVFLNYCRHRGAMPACGSGNAARFVCPYHAWTYKNTGELFVVPGQPGFGSMDKADYGLVELPSQERHGFIWAVLSADGSIDVDAHLGALGPELAALKYASYGYHAEKEFAAQVSWKGALEAFAEGYHFPFVHGESVIGQNTLANTGVYDEYGNEVIQRQIFESVEELQEVRGWLDLTSEEQESRRRSVGFLGPAHEHGRDLLDLPEPHPGQQSGRCRDHRHAARR